MCTWKITQILTKPWDPEWDTLAQLTLGNEVHPDRRTGFLLSRMALTECLKEKGYHLRPKELELVSFAEIKGLPQFTISLSHTGKIGAALVCEKSRFRSVGIDIEHEERVVKESIAHRVSHADDIKLRNIELWCLKEAVFKTLMNTGLFEKPLEFSSICLKNHSWSHFPSNLEGKWELELTNSMVVARAFLEN